MRFSFPIVFFDFLLTPVYPLALNEMESLFRNQTSEIWMSFSSVILLTIPNVVWFVLLFLLPYFIRNFFLEHKIPSSYLF